MRVASFWILSRFWRHRQMLDGLQLTPMWAVSSKKRWLIRNLAVCRVLHVLCLLWMPDWVDDSDSSELIFFCTCTHSENMQYIFPLFWFLPESETQASSSSICYLWLLCEITLLILGSERFLCTVPNGSRMRHRWTRNPQRPSPSPVHVFLEAFWSRTNWRTMRRMLSTSNQKSQSFVPGLFGYKKFLGYF